MSGTLSYLFNTYDPSASSSDPTARSWSSLVWHARALGYTEPDPRDDLSGVDVARKLVILARVAGAVHVEMSDVAVESLVPAPLRECSTAEFLDRLSEFDAEMSARARLAAERQHVLRLVGVVDFEVPPQTAESSSVTIAAASTHLPSPTVRVELREFPLDHPFAQMRGSENIFEFCTARYSPNPLIVRGQGAGAAVTAAGVLSDILHVATHCGSPCL